MADLEKVILQCKRAIDTGESVTDYCFYYDVITMLKEQETKTGHWIDTTKVIGFPRVQCSVCGSGQGAIWMNHCPNCGAKMEGR